MRRGLRATLVLGALLLALAAALLPALAAPERVFEVQYDVRILSGKNAAKVQITVSQPEAYLTALSFDADPERYSGFEGSGTLQQEGSSLIWEPPKAGGRLSYTVQIDHLREAAEYDARCTRDWALFRGEDVVPPVRVRFKKGSTARARLRLRVPPSWSVVTPFEPAGDFTWRIADPRRVLDAPRGWLIMGKLRIARAEVAGTEVVVAAPKEHAVRAREIIAFLRWTLPELQKAFGELPKRVVIVSANDPMWRGGLSGPNSIYLHADRPLIDPDGTSPLLHEFVHVATRARADEQGDWIAEGLAEYYSLLILQRAGAVTEDEYQSALASMRKRGRKAKTLFVERASGDVTRRAVGVLAALDDEIRTRTKGQASLDDVARLVSSDPEPVTYDRFRQQVSEVVGKPLKSFFDGRVS